jgi:sulfite exporter TauE/SafE
MQSNQTCAIPGKKNYEEIVAITLIVVGIYFLLKQLTIVPAIGVSDSMSYGVAFVLGLVAAVSTCTAVTGSLLLAVSSNYNQQHTLSKYQKFKPHIYFNAGRIISYAVLGGLLGIIGSKLVLSQTIVGILSIVVSLAMILLGLQLLSILPSFITLPRSIASKVFDAAEEKRSAPFLFGAATFFFPCGFTQALQLYVLTQGSFMQGALMMLFFSLGTLPALLSIGMLSSFSKGMLNHYVTRVAGVVVILFGILSLQSGLGLTGFSIVGGSADSVNTAPVVDGKQIIEMTVDGLSYHPSQFNIRQGVPVEWHINGKKAEGCAGVINVPQLGILQRLQRTQDTVITFTPQQKGKIDFSCSMWMAGPGAFNII